MADRIDVTGFTPVTASTEASHLCRIRACRTAKIAERWRTIARQSVTSVEAPIFARPTGGGADRIDVTG